MNNYFNAGTRFIKGEFYEVDIEKLTESICILYYNEFKVNLVKFLFYKNSLYSSEVNMRCVYINIV